MDEDEKKVIKRTPTIYPSGFRLARNSGAIVLEFLDDRDDSVEVTFSCAMNPEVVKELIRSLEQTVSLSGGDEK